MFYRTSREYTSECTHWQTGVSLFAGWLLIFDQIKEPGAKYYTLRLTRLGREFSVTFVSR